MSAKAKKRKSQVPVALVYFATMLLFLAVFGLIAFFLINRIEELNQPEPPAPLHQHRIKTTRYQIRLFFRSF